MSDCVLIVDIHPLILKPRLAFRHQGVLRAAICILRSEMYVRAVGCSARGVVSTTTLVG